MSQTKIRKYIPAVLAAAQTGLQRGGLYTVAVLHDDWCHIYKGGDCDCDPVVEAPVCHTDAQSMAAALARR